MRTDESTQPIVHHQVKRLLEQNSKQDAARGAPP